MRKVLSFLVLATCVRRTGGGTLTIGRSGAVSVGQLSAAVPNLPTGQQQGAGGRDSRPTTGPTERPLEQSGPDHRQPEDRQKKEPLAGLLVTLEWTLSHYALYSVLLGTARLDR